MEALIWITGTKGPAGATGETAIFADNVKAARFIRKVLLRQIAIPNCIDPFQMRVQNLD